MFSFVKKYAFLLMVLASIIFCIISFLSWNLAKKVDYASMHTINDNSVRLHVDNCLNDKKYFYIEGWVYSNTYPKEGSITVTLKDDSAEYLVPIQTKSRPDVSKAFALTQEFLRYGFSASIRKINIPEKASNISINILFGNTVNRVDYHCGK